VAWPYLDREALGYLVAMPVFTTTCRSAGIGKAVVQKLAKQGINVVMVALDDALLADSAKEIQAEFKSLTFIKVRLITTLWGVG